MKHLDVLLYKLNEVINQGSFEEQLHCGSGGGGTVVQLHRETIC